MGVSTLIKASEFAGDYKIVHITVANTGATDTISLTEATHGIGEITSILGTNIMQMGLQDTAGTVKAHLANVGISFSSLDLTLTSLEYDGTAATLFGYQVGITILGK